MEEWRDVVGAEKFYQISNYGRMKNKITDSIIKPSKSGKYRHIQLKYGINKNFLLHRMVAEAFIPNPLNLSMKEASEELGINYQGISSCCRNAHKSCGGYAWTYANIADIKKRWKKDRR